MFYSEEISLEDLICGKTEEIIEQLKEMRTETREGQAVKRLLEEEHTKFNTKHKTEVDALKKEIKTLKKDLADANALVSKIGLGVSTKMLHSYKEQVVSNLYNFHLVQNSRNIWI